MSWNPTSVLFQHPSNTFEVRPSIFVMEKHTKCNYYLCKTSNRSHIYFRCGVDDSMAIPLLLSADNHNIFRRLFGIEFDLIKEGMTEMSICQVSSFEHAYMFGYTERMTQNLAKRKYWPLLTDRIPANSSADIVNCILLSMSSTHLCQTPNWMRPQAALAAVSRPVIHTL